MSPASNNTEIRVFLKLQYPMFPSFIFLLAFFAPSCRTTLNNHRLKTHRFLTNTSVFYFLDTTLFILTQFPLSLYKAFTSSILIPCRDRVRDRDCYLEAVTSSCLQMTIKVSSLHCVTVRTFTCLLYTSRCV